MTSQAYNDMMRRNLRNRFSAAKEIVVTDAAPTKCGYRIVRHTPLAETTNTIFYRKASSGRWGRGVQLLEVALNCSRRLTAV